MIRLAGRVEGAQRLEFYPTISRLRDSLGTVIFNGTIAVLPDESGTFSVELPDGKTLLGYWGERWQWVCEEWSYGQKRVRFAFSADPAELRYVDIRPLGDAL